jgi:plastocyanin
MMRGALVPSLLALILLAGACAEDVSALRDRQVAGAAATIHILDSPETVGEFVPGFVHVLVGQRIAFVNASGDYHTVTFVSSPDGAPSSAGIAPGGTFEATLTRPGTYWYRCLYHQGMVGQIEVAAGPTPVPSPTASPGQP